MATASKVDLLLPRDPTTALSAATKQYVDRLALTPAAVQAGAYTASPGDFVPVDTTMGSVSITLPTTPADRTVIAIKQVVRGGTNTVTYTTGGTDALNTATGPTAGVLTLVNQGVLLQYKAAAGIWYGESTDLALSQLDLRFTTPAQSTSTAVALSLVLGG